MGVKKKEKEMLWERRVKLTGDMFNLSLSDRGKILRLRMLAG